MPTGSETINSSNIQTLSRSITNNEGQIVETDAYFSLSGVTYAQATAQLGTSSNNSASGNYYATTFWFDGRGRVARVLSPTGTITRTVYDGLNRVSSTWVDTNDTPTSGYWSPTNNTGTSNMVDTQDNVYDNGGAGDGNLTQVTQHPGAGQADRVTWSFYDWRDRLVAEKDGVLLGTGGTENLSGETTDGVHRPIFYTVYDNLGEVTGQYRYDGDGVAVTSTAGVPNQPSASLLRAEALTSYDEQGRVYRTQTYSVDPTSGAVSANPLTSNLFFDKRGNVIESVSPGGLATKSTYDGADRMTFSYQTDGGVLNNSSNAGTWAAAGSVAGDIVLTQTKTIYDSNGNPIESITSDRFHTDVTTSVGDGALGTPTTGVKARVSYAAQYYDAVNRKTADVNVGTNGGSAWTRPSSAPSSSDTVLVSTYAYNAGGWLDTSTDPRGIVTKTFYDLMGRTTETVDAYDGGAPTNSTNQETVYTYDGDDNVLTEEAILPSSAFQTTQYIYGVTTSGGSNVNSNDILQATEYPDPTTGSPSSSQKESYTTNALGQRLTYTDRNGNVHTYAYDVLGRMTSDTATTLGTGVDSGERRISYTYNTQDLPYLYTTYSDTGGTTIVNQDKMIYDGLGNLTFEYQEYSGAVTGSTEDVQYTYADPSLGARPTSMTYPTGWVVNYNYATGIDTTISRLSNLSDSANTLETYQYLGLDTPVIIGHPQTGVHLTYVKQSGESNGEAGDQYVGLDRFGRIVDQRWLNGSTVVDRLQYGYDRDGNELYMNNLGNSAFSELYHPNSTSSGDDDTACDPLGRLTAYARGTLGASGNNGSVLDTIATSSASAIWSMDAVGNMTSVTTNGTAHSRTTNKLNEVTAVSGSASPTYDSNGDMTKAQNGDTIVFNAWNEMVKIKNSGGTTLETYQYDGQGRQVLFTTSTATVWRYFSKNWQVLESGGTGTGVEPTQQVWSPFYVDGYVVRNRDTLNNGTYDERLYAEWSADWDIISLTTTAGAVEERAAWDPYGNITYLDSTWGSASSSAAGWQYYHQGMKYDAATGLYLGRTRDYDPKLQRWVEADPAGYVDGMNRYEYEQDQPITNRDPSSMAVGAIAEPVGGGLPGGGPFGGGGGMGWTQNMSPIEQLLWEIMNENSVRKETSGWKKEGQIYTALNTTSATASGNATLATSFGIPLGPIIRIGGSLIGFFIGRKLPFTGPIAPWGATPYFLIHPTPTAGGWITWADMIPLYSSCCSGGSKNVTYLHIRSANGTPPMIIGMTLDTVSVECDFTPTSYGYAESVP